MPRSRRAATQRVDYKEETSSEEEAEQQPQPQQPPPAAPVPATPYELEREARLARNAAMLRELGLQPEPVPSAPTPPSAAPPARPTDRLLERHLDAFGLFFDQPGGPVAGRGISVERLRLLRDELKLELSDAELIGMVNCWDADGDGQLSADEFSTMLVDTNALKYVN